MLTFSILKHFCKFFPEKINLAFSRRDFKPLAFLVAFKKCWNSHRRNSVKKLFLKIVEDSQENTMLESFFNSEYCEIFSNTYFEEKLDSVLGPPGPQDPRYLRITWTPGTPRTSGPSNPMGFQDLGTLGKLRLPFEIQNLNTQKLWNWHINKGPF